MRSPSASSLASPRSAPSSPRVAPSLRRPSSLRASRSVFVPASRPSAVDLEVQEELPTPADSTDDEAITPQPPRPPSGRPSASRPWSAPVSPMDGDSSADGKDGAGGSPVLSRAGSPPSGLVSPADAMGQPLHSPSGPRSDFLGLSPDPMGHGAQEGSPDPAPAPPPRAHSPPPTSTRWAAAGRAVPPVPSTSSLPWGAPDVAPAARPFALSPPPPPPNAEAPWPAPLPPSAPPASDSSDSPQGPSPVRRPPPPPPLTDASDLAALTAAVRDPSPVPSPIDIPAAPELAAPALVETPTAAPTQRAWPLDQPRDLRPPPPTPTLLMQPSPTPVVKPQPQPQSHVVEPEAEAPHREALAPPVSPPQRSASHPSLLFWRVEPPSPLASHPASLERRSVSHHDMHTELAVAGRSVSAQSTRPAQPAQAQSVARSAAHPRLGSSPPEPRHTEERSATPESWVVDVTAEPSDGSAGPSRASPAAPAASPPPKPPHESWHRWSPPTADPHLGGAGGPPEPSLQRRSPTWGAAPGASVAAPVMPPNPQLRRRAQLLEEIAQAPSLSAAGTPYQPPQAQAQAQAHRALSYGSPHPYHPEAALDHALALAARVGRSPSVSQSPAALGSGAQLMPPRTAVETAHEELQQARTQTRAVMVDAAVHTVFTQERGVQGCPPCDAAVQTICEAAVQTSADVILAPAASTNTTAAQGVDLRGPAAHGVKGTHGSMRELRLSTSPRSAVGMALPPWVGGGESAASSALGQPWAASAAEYRPGAEADALSSALSTPTLGSRRLSLQGVTPVPWARYPAAGDASRSSSAVAVAVGHLFQGPEAHGDRGGHGSSRSATPVFAHDAPHHGAPAVSAAVSAATTPPMTFAEPHHPPHAGVAESPQPRPPTPRAQSHPPPPWADAIAAAAESPMQPVASPPVVSPAPMPREWTPAPTTAPPTALPEPRGALREARGHLGLAPPSDSDGGRTTTGGTTPALVSPTAGAGPLLPALLERMVRGPAPGPDVGPDLGPHSPPVPVTTEAAIPRTTTTAVRPAETLPHGGLHWDPATASAALHETSATAAPSAVSVSAASTAAPPVKPRPLMAPRHSEPRASKLLDVVRALDGADPEALRAAVMAAAVLDSGVPVIACDDAAAVLQRFAEDGRPARTSRRAPGPVVFGRGQSGSRGPDAVTVDPRHARQLALHGSGLGGEAHMVEDTAFVPCSALLAALSQHRNDGQDGPPRVASRSGGGRRSPQPTHLTGQEGAARGTRRRSSGATDLGHGAPRRVSALQLGVA